MALMGLVVICLKISIFVVATTTSFQRKATCTSCDLLKNIYLCGSNNNEKSTITCTFTVVICLKISIFVVATTTCHRYAAQAVLL